jgi:hypothetical protein
VPLSDRDSEPDTEIDALALPDTVTLAATEGETVALGVTVPETVGDCELDSVKPAAGVFDGLALTEALGLDDGVELDVEEEDEEDVELAVMLGVALDELVALGLLDVVKNLVGDGDGDTDLVGVMDHDGHGLGDTEPLTVAEAVMVAVVVGEAVKLALTLGDGDVEGV